MEKTLKINNCLDCPNHQVIRDPDPYDSFCSDDSAVVCKLVANPRKNPNSKYVVDRQDFRIVACSCRPHRLRGESDIPDWCPLNA